MEFTAAWRKERACWSEGGSVCFLYPLLLFSRSVMSNSLQPRGLQHTRLSCPSPSPGVCSNSCPLSLCCLPTISPSVTPFSSCPQFCPPSGSLPTSWLCNRWPNYWSFSISPSNEYSGLISFRNDWFDLHAVQGSLKSLLQHHNLKASVLQFSALFMACICIHLYMTTGKTIVLTIQTFVVCIEWCHNFLPRSKRLLISWLQSPSAVILEPPKIKSVTVSTVTHLFAMKWWDQMPWS